MIGRIRDLIRSRRPARTTDLRLRVAEDAERARLQLVAVIVDARRVGAPVPDEVGDAVVTLAGWTHGLRAWARESEQ